MRNSDRSNSLLSLGRLRNHSAFSPKPSVEVHHDHDQARDVEVALPPVHQGFSFTAAANPRTWSSVSIAVAISRRINPLSRLLRIASERRARRRFCATAICSGLMWSVCSCESPIQPSLRGIGTLRSNRWLRDGPGILSDIRYCPVFGRLRNRQPSPIGRLTPSPRVSVTVPSQPPSSQRCDERRAVRTTGSRPSKPA